MWVEHLDSCCRSASMPTASDSHRRRSSQARASGLLSARWSWIDRPCLVGRAYNRFHPRQVRGGVVAIKAPNPANSRQRNTA